jgi:hypothetical protein
MTQPPSKASDIAVVIRQYLATHPKASDSLEGVQRWWLGEGEVEAPSTTVQQALDELVRNGALVKRMLPDGAVVYAGIGPEPPPP